jgi:hypothetical protein
VPEGVRTLEAAQQKFGVGGVPHWFDFVSDAYLAKYWADQLEAKNCSTRMQLFFGAVGWPYNSGGSFTNI